MKPFSELFTNNFFGITFVAFICTQSICKSKFYVSKKWSVGKILFNDPPASCGLDVLKKPLLNQFFLLFLSDSGRKCYPLKWPLIFLNILGPQFLWSVLFKMTRFKGFHSIFWTEELGASEAHKIEILDYEALKIKEGNWNCLQKYG